MDSLRLKILDLLKEELGEYSHLEVKEEVSWSTLDKKAEFIRDIQSLCNSLSSEDYRYLIIGYNKHKKVFKDVTNHQDFDDGKLVSMLSAYFDPEITFKTFSFKTDKGEQFIVIEFPTKDLIPPHIIKKEIGQQNKEPILNMGEIWIKGGGKGGSSAKRRATRDDLYAMFDSYIERQTEKRSQIRVDEILKKKQLTAVAQELISPENFDVSVIYRDDEIFMNLIKQLVLGEKAFYLRELSEALHQNVISSWEKTKNDEIKLEDAEKFPDLVNDIKNNHIQPSIRKLVLFASQLTRMRAYPTIFEKLLETLSVFYSYGYKSEYGIHSNQNLKYPNENLSFSLPSVESMAAFHLLGSYAAKVNNSLYLSKIINMTAHWENYHTKRLMMFLSLSGDVQRLAIPELRNPDGKTLKNLINFYAEKGDYLTPLYFTNNEDLLNWLASFDLIIELNSQALIYNWTNQKKLKEQEFLKAKAQLPEGTEQYKIEELSTEIYGEYNYWRAPFAYYPNCLQHDFQRVSYILERLIALYKQGNTAELKNYFAKDKHLTLDFVNFDKFILDSVKDVKKQRNESSQFSLHLGGFGGETENFLKITAKKYP